MNQRMVSIVYELNKPNKNVKLADMAELFQVSQRTIRKDLNTLNEILFENGLHELKLGSGGQIIIPENLGEILSVISGEDFYQYKLSKGERKRIASAILVNSTKFITLSMIADKLFVSRATVINDLDDIKDYIKKVNMRVISHPNKGLYVEGKESDKRQFLTRAIAGLSHEVLKNDAVYLYISTQGENHSVLSKIVNEQEHVHRSFLTDNSFQKVVLYLELMIKRNLQGEYIEKQEHTGNSKYRMAQDILKYVSQYCHIHTTEDEVIYLSEILVAVRYTKQESHDIDTIKIQLMTRQFIEGVSEELGMDLNGDYDFFVNLSNHLESVLSSENSAYPDTSILDEIMEENKSIVELVKQMVPIIRQYTTRDLTEIEMEYIAVHICAAVERKKNNEIAFSVIVACNAGIGTSQLLLEKLKEHFNFQIVDIVSFHEAKNIDEGSADFVISTVLLIDCKLEHVVVSPMLNDEDYIRIGNKIDSLRINRNLPTRLKDKKMSVNGLLEQIDPVLYETVPNEAPVLIKKMRKIIKAYFNQSMEKDTDIFQPELHHLLPHTHIKLDVECADWKEAVSKSAEKLLEWGCIEERYIDAMIANIEEFGNYIIISDEFAFPHGRIEQGCVKLGMYLIQLKTPVLFGTKDQVPVRYVCCLSAIDKKSHLKAVFHLSIMLKNSQFKQQLKLCTSDKAIADLIQQYEYQL